MQVAGAGGGTTCAGAGRQTRGVLSNPEKAGVVVEGGQREGRGLEK